MCLITLVEKLNSCSRLFLSSEYMKKQRCEVKNMHISCKMFILCQIVCLYRYKYLSLPLKR